MLGFFESIVFKRKAQKYIDSNAGFSDVVGMTAVKKGKGTRQQQRQPGQWKSVGSQEEDPLASVLGIWSCLISERAKSRMKKTKEIARTSRSRMSNNMTMKAPEAVMRVWGWM
jgi:hypothetical protein